MLEKVLLKPLLQVIRSITRRTISEIKWGQLEGGTAIGMGLGSAVNRLKESEAKSKVIIFTNRRS